MPTLKVTLPGGNETFLVDAAGFATEATVNSMLRVLEKSHGTTSKTAKVQRDNSEALQEGTDALMEFGETIDLTNDEVLATSSVWKKMGKAVEGLTSLADQSAASLQNMSFSGSDSQGKLRQLANIAGRLTESLAAITDGIPIISQIAKGGDAVMQGLSLVTEFTTQVLEALRDEQRQLYNSGVFFANGIDTAAQLASDSGTTLGYLSKAASEASDALRRSNGGAAKALTKTAQSFDILRKKVDASGKAQVEQLYTLGYTQDEILAGIARFNSTMDLSGKSMSTEELAAASRDYLVTMKELDRLTGEDVNQRKAAAEQLNNELAFRQYMRTLDGPQATAAQDLITSLETINPAMAQLAKYQLMGIQPTDKAMALLQNEMPGFSRQMADARQSLLDGTLTFDKIPGIIADVSKTSKDEIDRFSSSVGGYQMLAYFEQGSTIMKNVIDVLGPAYNKFDQVAKASDTTNTAESITKNAGELSEAIAKYTNIEVELANMMQGAAIVITKSVINLAETLGAKFKEMLGILGFSDSGVYDPATAKMLEDDKKRLEGEKAKYELGFDDIDITPKLDDMGVGILSKPTDPIHVTDDKVLKQIQDNNDTLIFGPKPYGPLGPNPYWKNPDDIPKGSSVDLAPPIVKPMSYESPTGESDKPITVTFASYAIWEEMRDHLKTLNATNAQIVRTMDRGNTIAKQNGYASA